VHRDQAITLGQTVAQRQNPHRIRRGGQPGEKENQRKRLAATRTDPI